MLLPWLNIQTALTCVKRWGKSSFSDPCPKIIFIHSLKLSLKSTTITQILLCKLSLAVAQASKNIFWQYTSTFVIWTAAGYSFGFSEPHIFSVFEGRQAGRVVLMCWRIVGGRKRQLLFISMRGRPLWEDEWRGAFQKISESERVGRHQDIIREVCLLPCYYGWNKWFRSFRPKIHLPCVVSSGITSEM